MAIIAGSIYKKGRISDDPASFLISIWRIELFLYMRLFLKLNVNAI